MNKENLTKLKPTFDSVWLALQETDRMQKETFGIVKEATQGIREATQGIREATHGIREATHGIREATHGIRESNEMMKGVLTETSNQINKTEQKWFRLNKKIESWGLNQGSFAEDYFFNSFEDGDRTFFGETFDEIEPNMKGIKKGYKDEYDILLINGHALFIVESKYKAHINDIPKVVRKAETIRVNFPEYKDYVIFLGLASMSFYDDLEQECLKEGIAVIKQIGENVVIFDKNLKKFLPTDFA